MASAIKTVGIVGAGVIGSSWAALFLSRGLRVLVSDPSPTAKDEVEKHVREMWPTLETLGLARDASIDNLHFVGASIAPHGAELDFVQENGPERPDIKTKIIAEIDRSTRPEVLIASSSSGLPSSKFVSECQHPERVLIGHPFNPPHLMPLVEVVPHPGTSQTATQTALEFYRACGKAPVFVKQEIPGFAANRLQIALCNEAYSLVQRGILTAEEVDLCMTNSLGPRWAAVGPFMANALAGGALGFKHLMEHVGVASQVWVEDMKAHEFKLTPDSIEKLDGSVQKLLEVHPTEQAEQYRDAVTLDLLKLKKEKLAVYSK